MAFTRVVGAGIHTLSNITSHNIHSSGIVTATALDISGNATIGGVLTYEDVTSIDSVGIVTARKGVRVNADGNTVANYISVGENDDLKIFHHSSGVSQIHNSTGYFEIASNTATWIKNTQFNVIDNDASRYHIRTFKNDRVELYHNNQIKLTTTDKGIKVGTGVTIETNGQATFTGIVTFGSSSTTIDGDANTVKVGTALTLGHTQGLQFHTQNLHSQGFEVNQINATGVITATSFSGSGANLTGLASREVYGFTGIGNSLSLTTTNNGADDITNATYVAFEENFIGPSGISFSINTSGNLIMTV